MAKLIDKAVDKLTTSITFEQLIGKVNTGLTVILCGVIGAVVYYYANGLHLVG